MMDLLFLIPLSVGLLAGYISQNADLEIAYLTTTVSVVSLFASLIIAPWQIQLLILLLVMFGARQLWQKTENQLNLEKSEQEQTQQFSNNSNQRKYRGVSYEKTHAEEKILDNTTVGKYRGISWKKTNFPTEITLSFPTKLKYRGNSITTKTTEPPE
jgi:hypothetical protein